MSRFTTVFADDFTTALDPARWHLYSGLSTASGSAFDPANVTVTGGKLVLAARKQPDGTWRGAGLKSSVNLTHGRFTVRSRIEAGRGVTLVHLLWPATDTWPPEVDFAEDNGGDRSLCTATAHWADATGNQQAHATVAVDLTQWHTWVVEWTPGSLVYRCDGVKFGSAPAAAVPSVPMHLALQTEPWTTATTWEHAVDATTPPTVRTYIDRVRVESYT